jgi:hypothetical protein
VILVKVLQLRLHWIYGDLENGKLAKRQCM